MAESPYELPDQLLLSRGQPSDIAPIRVQLLPSSAGLRRAGRREIFLRRKLRRWSPWLIGGSLLGMLVGLGLLSLSYEHWVARATVTAPAAEAVLSDGLLAGAVGRMGTSQRERITVPDPWFPWWRRRADGPEAMLRGARESVRLTALGKESFAVEAAGTDAGLAAGLANAIAAEWVAGWQLRQKAIARAGADTLTPELDRQRAKLADAEAALTAYLRPFRYTLRDASRLPADAAVQVDELRASIESERHALQQLENRARDAALLAATRSAEAVVHPATQAKREPPSGIWWLPLLGMLGGVAAGLVAAATRDLLRHSIQDPGESQRLTGLPELGVIPTSQSHPYWESSFRHLLSSLWLSGAGEKRPRVVALVSPDRRAGTSTIVCQLGITLATTNRRVLLVDAHLAAPQLHKFFSLDNDRGLTDVLADETPVEEYFFSRLVQETGVPGLYLLPAGSGAAPEAALTHVERLHDLLVRFRLEFHAVLIDAGPVLPSPDGRLLGRLADGAIQVHRSGATRREHALESVHRLQDDGTTVFGTVLNGAIVPTRLR